MIDLTQIARRRQSEFRTDRNAGRPAPQPAGVTERVLVAAQELAADLFAGDDQRWAHTCAVADRAGQAAIALPDQQVPALLAAAWLHDIGKAGDLHDTGFHPLDGARYLHASGSHRWSPGW